MAGRAMIRTSQPGWNEAASARRISRSLLRTRLRTTAPPSFRPVDRPNRVVSRSVRRKRTARSGWDRTKPSPWSARKSLGRESTTRRGAVAPRSPVRRSAACGRARGVRPGSVGHRGSASGHESRAPWRDGASLAGRSASSGLCAILSIRPRVRRCYRPLKARERAGRTQALGALDVRADYGTRQRGCQTTERPFRRSVGRPPDGVGSGLRRSIRRPMHGYPLGVSTDSCRIALRGPDGRCYPSRAVGAGKRGGSLWRTSGGAPGADRRRPAERAETSHATVPPSPRPWPTIPIDQPIR